jgi:hypothetical protein
VHFQVAVRNALGLESSNAVCTSALVFITNGPPQAIGSRIGVPPSTTTSSAAWRDS